MLNSYGKHGQKFVVLTWKLTRVNNIFLMI